MMFSQVSKDTQEHFRVEKVEDVVNIGDEIWVKVTEIDDKGRINLIHKGVTAPENND